MTTTKMSFNTKLILTAGIIQVSESSEIPNLFENTLFIFFYTPDAESSVFTHFRKVAH